jgi:hypothetical protein
MSDSYYVRIRGEVKGPVARSELVSQIRKKRMGRHHEVSTDAVTWVRAGDVPDLFEPVVAAREPVVSAVAASEESRAGSASAQPEGATSSSSETEWFYAKGRNRLGPVTESELRTMLATARISGSDLVWNDSLEDWIAAGSLPQFAGVSSAPIADGRSEHSSEIESRRAGFFEIILGLSQGATLPEKAAWKFPNLTRYLSIAEGALRILFVIQLVVIAAGWIYQIVLSIRLENAFGLITGLFYGPIMTLFAWLFFISLLAVLEVVKVLIRIEHNTSQS